MGIRVAKPYFEKILAPFERLCVRARISSTTLNLLSLASSCIVATSIKLGSHSLNFLLLIPIFACLRMIFSTLDAMIRKNHHSISNIDSELLNDFFNRMSDIVIFASFALIPTVDSFFASMTVGLVLLVSYMGIMGKAVAKTRTRKGVMGKSDRMLYLSIYAVLMYFYSHSLDWNYFLIFIALGTIITIFVRWTAIEKQVREARR